MPPETSLSAIQNFLANRRFAMIGVSRNPRHFSSYLMKEMRRRGYDVVPVNPAAADIGGSPCAPSVREIHPPVAAALIITPAEQALAVVQQCAEAGIRQVWLYRATGQGSVSAEAVAYCRDHGIEVVVGECPLMFVGHPGFHVIHGWVRKIQGTYPRLKPA